MYLLRGRDYPRTFTLLDFYKYEGNGARLFAESSLRNRQILQ